MAISGKDIEIVVGVEGGASLSTGSGKQIKESLDGIFKQLDPKLDLKLDTTKIARNIEKDIKKVLSDVNVEIGKVQAQWVKLGETMKISIPMSNTKTGESYQYLAEANVDAKKLSGALQSVAQDYAALQKSADAAYDKLIKNVQKRLEYQKQMKTADSDSWGYQQAEKAKQAIEDENKSLIKLIANIQKLGVESSKADEYADAKNAAKSELLRYDAYVKRLAKQEEATERAKVQAAAEKELDAVYAELIKKENELLPLEKALFSNEEGTTKYKQAERECEAVIEEVAALKERADVLEKNGAVSQKAEEYNKAYTESAIRLVEYIDDLAAKEEQLAEKEAQLAAQRERSDSTERAKENMRLAQEEATERAKAQAAAEKAAAAEQKAADASISAEKAKASAIAAAEKKIETALSWTAAANTKEYKAIVAASQELQNAEGLTENRIKELTTVIDQNSTAIRMAGNAHQSLGDQLTKNASKFTAWLGTSQLVMKAIQTIKKMITNVTELDTAMTELKKVTDETDETYGRFLDNAAEKAKSIGTTMTDFVNATASFARLGFGVEDASTLAEVATIYKNVGDGISTIDEASESIISTMQAFGVETSNVISIVDKFNNVGNNFAISSGGIGEAMLNSASAMHAANNTLDETIALITAANKVVQNPQKVGTALKTMSMYLRAAKTEAEEAGESTEGMANSVSELREEILKLTGNKVDIQIDENTFKSTYQILKELSEVWGELSDISQANILEMIGGKRGANVGSALIENFSVAEEALATSLDSVGSAVKENEKYLDSIEGRISQFKATFQDFSNDFVSSDLLKNIISFGTGALGVLDSIVEKMSALEIAASIGATASLIKFAGALKTALKAGTELSVAMKAAAASNWVTLALTALPLIIELIDKLTVSSGELIENANDIISTFDSAKTSYKNNISAIEDLRDEYEQLSQGVDENGNNISLTADEYDRYHEIISKIVDISPSVVQGYNKEGDAIVNYKGLIDDAIESQEEFLNNQTLIYLGQGTDIFEGKKKEYEDALDGLEGSFTRIAEAANDSADQMIGEFFENLIMHGVDALKMANDTKTTAWRDAMKQIGMDENFYLNGVQASDVEQLTTLYERRAQFIDALRSTEKYSEEELTALNAAIVQLGTDFDNLRKIQEEQINYLLTYAKQNTDVDTGWFLEIPDGAVDNFKNGLFDVIDSTKTCTENLQILNQYGREFADVFGSRDVQSVLAMADGLKDGSVSVEDYNAKVSQLEGRLEYMGPICDTIIGYLRELTNVGNEGGGALEGISGQVETVGDSLSEYIELLDDLEDKFGLIETAQKEMEDAGSISVSTIQKLQEATEDYLDYLYVEDGQIKLNTKSWYEFCTAKSKAALIEYKSRLSELQAERQNIIGCISAADDFGDSTTELKGKQAELETQIAETELIIGIMESTMHGLTEVTDEASDETEELATAWDNASGALSRFSSGLSDIRSAYTTLKTAVDEYNSSGSLTYDTLLSLIKLDPQYLACLRAENGQLVLNEEALTLLAEAQRLEAIEALEAARETDLLAIALGDTQSASSFAQAALAAAGGAMDEVAFKAYAAAKYVQMLNTALAGHGIKDTSKGGKSSEDIVNDAYDGLLNTIGTVDLSGFVTGGYTPATSDNNSGGNGETETAIKEVEEYVAAIDKYYSAVKKLASVQREVAEMQHTIDSTSDQREKISLTRQLIDLYADEAEAETELMRQRQSTIQQNVAQLQKLGFVVDYNIEKNELYIENLEHLNELTTEEQGDYETLQDAINALRKETEDLIDTTESLNDANQDSADSLVDIADSAKEASEAIDEYFEEIRQAIQETVAAANELVDGFQNVYDTLTTAAKEWAQTGYLSVDAYQAILDLGPQYLEMLQDESGQLVINEERLQKVIAAKTEELGAETALAYAKQIMLATEQKDIELLTSLCKVTEASGDATWDLAYATLGYAKALGEANDIAAEYYDNAFENLQRMQALTQTAVNSISAYYDTLNSEYISQADAVKKIYDMVSEMIKWENQQAVKALEEQKDAQDDIYDDQIKEAKEYYDNEKDNIKDYYSDLLDETKDYYSNMKDEAQDYYDDLKEQTEDYYDDLKETRDDYYDGLKEQIDSIIDKRKEDLRLSKTESDRNKTNAKKLKEIAELQAKIEQLSLDESREAQAERRKLESELRDLQEDLADEQADYSLDVTLDMLDKQKDEYDDTIDKEKAAFDKMISEERKAALELIADRKEAELDRIDKEKDAEIKRIEEERDAALKRNEEELDDALARINAEKDAYDQMMQDQIDALENRLSSAEKLHQEVIARLNSDWDTLYAQLEQWNYEYGSTLQSDLENAWAAASAAAERYGGIVNALNGVNEYTTIGSSIDTPTATAARETYTNAYEETSSGGANAAAGQAILEQMKQNSMNWFLSGASGYQSQLHDTNDSLAEQYYQATGNKLTYNSSAGAWMLNGSPAYTITSAEKRSLANQIVDAMKTNWGLWEDGLGSWELYSGLNTQLAKNLGMLTGTYPTWNGSKWMYGSKELFATKFHSGGGTDLESDELHAVLQRGEAVLTQGNQKTLADIIAISAKLGQVLSGTSLGQAAFRDYFSAPSVGNVTNNNNASTFSPSINVYITHSGELSDSDARKYGNTIADIAIDKINDACSRRGMSTLGGSFLK